MTSNEGKNPGPFLQRGCSSAENASALNLTGPLRCAVVLEFRNEVSRGRFPLSRLGGPQMRLSLPVRRSITVGIAVLLFVIAIGVQLGGKGSYEYNARLAATAPRLDAVISAEHWSGRGMTAYEVTVDDQTFALVNDELVEGGAEIGRTVEVVLDPEDPDVAIAVGTPTDWDRDPMEESLWLVALLACAGLIAAWIAAKLLPEDRNRVGHLIRSWLSRPKTH
jgi:hypothetical protein